jgi:hypothetical protein
MSNALLERLVAEVVALRERVAALETKEMPGKFAELVVSGDGRVGGGLYVGSTSVDPATGCIELGEISAPSSPGSNIARIYAREAGSSGRTNVYMKGDDGTERAMSVGQGCQVYNSSNISVSNDTDTYLTFDSEEFDNDSCHSTSTNTGRLTCNTAGTYLVTANINFAANSTGYRAIWFRINGSTVFGTVRVPAASSLATMLTTCRVIQLAVGDYLELGVRQNSGGNLNVQRVADTSPYFSMVRIG